MTEEKVDQEVIEKDDSLNVQEEVTETEVEETPVEETDSDVPTLEDYRELEKKNKMLYERVKKAEGTLKSSSQNTNQKLTEAGLTKEEVILYSKGYTDEEVQLAKKLAAVEGTNPLVISESDDYFKSKVSVRKERERSETASLGASTGGNKMKPKKSVGDMTDEEHREYFYKVMNNV